jgi:mRNA-degrading endonuclease RelE of RelBE toxin-antitoxin system
MISFSETKEFKKEFKKLSKKYKTLKKDLDDLKRLYLTVAPQGNGAKHWNCLHKNEKIEIYKMRMHCDATKGKFFRVIYAYHCDTGKVEMIEFIEIYFKGKKANEDRERIALYIKLHE